jgi:hypothetical protein
MGLLQGEIFKVTFQEMLANRIMNSMRERRMRDGFCSKEDC